MSPLPLQPLLPTDSPPLTPGFVAGGTFEVQELTEETYENLFPNPNMAYGIGAFLNSTESTVADPVYSGLRSQQYVVNADGDMFVSWLMDPIEPDTDYTFLSHIFATQPNRITTTIAAWYNNSTGFIDWALAEETGLLNGDWTAVQQTVHTPPNADYADFFLIKTDNLPRAGEVFTLDSIALVKGTRLPRFFSGNDRGARWTGGQDVSTSVITIPELTTIAYSNDVLTGLQLTRSLTDLNKLTFSIPQDRFSTSLGSRLSDLHDLFLRYNTPASGLSPYAKARQVRDHVYVKYTTEANGVKTERLFRVVTIDYDDHENLSGTALDAGVELSDYLVQYAAGTSQFSGALPSEIANRNLKGHQSLAIQNRRFTRDTQPSFTLAQALDDMTPVNISSGINQPRPKAFMTDLVATTPNDLAVVSGIPAESIPPWGLPNGVFNFGRGNVWMLSFADAGFAYGSTAAGLPFWGSVANLYEETTMPTFLAWENVDIGHGFRAGDPSGYISRIFYGSIRATHGTGIYYFEIDSTRGPRVSFANNILRPELTQGNPSVYSWTVPLESDCWYPFVFHIALQEESPSLLNIKWIPPDAVGSPPSFIDGAAVAPSMHGGLCCLRVTDSLGVVRFLMAFKRWDGAAMTLAYPLPASIFSAALTAGPHWPTSIPAGALVEEMVFPVDLAATRVQNWGTGWTRKPGGHSRVSPVNQTAVFQPHAQGYGV